MMKRFALIGMIVASVLAAGCSRVETEEVAPTETEWRTYQRFEVK